MELNLSIMQLHKSTTERHETIMELQNDCRIMNLPKLFMEFHNLFIDLHFSIMELYNPIYGNLQFEFLVSIIRFMNISNN